VLGPNRNRSEIEKERDSPPMKTATIAAQTIGSLQSAAARREALLARRSRALSNAAPAAVPPGAICFDSGHAFPAVLPDLTVEAELALTMHRGETLQYAPRPGLPELRDWIAEYMRADGVPGVAPEDVLVTNGAKHALELVCRLLLEEGDAIVVTAPTYFTAIPIFRSFGVEFLEVPQDSEGLCVGELHALLESRNRAGLPQPKFVYDVSDFHNPTGATISRSRREQLVALAEQYGVFLVEDSPYRKVRFDGEPLPSWKSLDRSGMVLSLGTFSKLLAPGLRVGWVCAARDLINRLIQLKADGGSCPLTQRTILEFCRLRRLPDHIARVQQVYREHRDRMVAAVRRELPEAEMNVPQGGYYVWLTLPEPVDGDQLARRAQERGVIFIPGSRFFALHAASRRRHIRLAYSHATPDEIDCGVRIMGELLHGAY